MCRHTCKDKAACGHACCKLDLPTSSTSAKPVNIPVNAVVNPDGTITVKGVIYKVTAIGGIDPSVLVSKEKELTNEIERWSNNFTDLQKTVTSTLKVNSRMKARIEELEKSLKEETEKKDNLSSNLSKQLTLLNSEYDEELEKEVKKREDLKLLLSSRIKTLTNDIEEAHKQRDSLSVKIKELLLENEKISTEKGNIRALSSELENTRTRVKNLQEEVKKKDSALSKLKEGIIARDTEIKRLSDITREVVKERLILTERLAFMPGPPLSSDECVICFANAPEVVYSCGHFCVCRGCDKKVDRKEMTCPLCRDDITTRINIVRKK